MQQKFSQFFCVFFATSFAKLFPNKFTQRISFVIKLHKLKLYDAKVTLSTVSRGCRFWLFWHHNYQVSLIVKKFLYIHSEKQITVWAYSVFVNFFHILRFDSLGHIYRFYNRILFSECIMFLIAWFTSRINPAVTSLVA